MVNMEPLMHEAIWFDKWRYEDAETEYQEHLAGTSKPPAGYVLKAGGIRRLGSNCATDTATLKQGSHRHWELRLSGNGKMCIQISAKTGRSSTSQVYAG